MNTILSFCVGGWEDTAKVAVDWSYIGKLTRFCMDRIGIIYSVQWPTQRTRHEILGRGKRIFLLFIKMCVLGRTEFRTKSRRPRSHRTRKQVCVQICVQTLWCCLQPVWTLPFDYSVFHNLRAFVAGCSASSVNGAEEYCGVRPRDSSRLRSCQQKVPWTGVWEGVKVTYLPYLFHLFQHHPLFFHNFQHKEGWREEVGPSGVGVLARGFRCCQID